MGKIKTSVSIDEETLKWIRKEIRSKRFASVSHAVEYAMEKLREKRD